DIEPRMISYAQENLDWLKTKFPLQTPHIFLEVQDATTFVDHNVIDSVATETYLGRPFTTAPSSEMLTKTISEVNTILKKFLVTMHEVLPPDARLCIAVPAWQIRPGQFKHLPLVDQISEMGYNRIRFEHARDDQLLYYREDQIVARELLVLTKQ